MRRKCLTREENAIGTRNKLRNLGIEENFDSYSKFKKLEQHA